MINPKRIEIEEKSGSKIVGKSRFNLDGEKFFVRFIRVVANFSHQAAIDHLGRLWTWGDGSEGCLAHEAANDETAPRCVENLRHLKTVDVGIGDKFLAVLTISRAYPEETKFQQRFRSILMSEIKQNSKVKVREFKKALAFEPIFNQEHIRLLGKEEHWLGDYEQQGNPEVSSRARDIRGSIISTPSIL